ncbi:hypothetical protein BpHYR1_042450 [Brachionus plicatilis]|uniref:Uncharacterized protein n=1 Tax=Brachionus plicatilis TaxID=10195 RepID=A0A3M7QWF4_BRAPC|nr:hypothetical protein BpHYR1_042450 [Brachionus plicatilis]
MRSLPSKRLLRILFGRIFEKIAFQYQLQTNDWHNWTLNRLYLMRTRSNYYIPNSSEQDRILSDKI